jgi:hypothetical protein
MRLGQLNVHPPEFFRTPVQHIAAQQVATLTQPCLLSPGSVRSGVATQQLPKTLGYGDRPLLALLTAGADFLQPLLDALLGGRIDDGEVTLAWNTLDIPLLADRKGTRQRD